MKKIYIYSIILSILAFASPLYGNVIDYKKNGDWESGFVNDYESVTLTQNNVGVQFGITSKKNLCFIEAFKLFIPKFDERIENSNSGFLRIDKNDIYIFTYQYVKNNNCYTLYIHFPDVSQSHDIVDRIIEQMKNGNILRIKMDTVMPIYYKFSLNGFSKSFEWLKKCCYKNSLPHLNTPEKESKNLDKIIKKHIEKDEDYFP